MTTWVWILLGGMAGAVLTALVFLLVLGGWYIGNLREEPDPEETGTYYFMEITSGGINRVKRNKFVILRVAGRLRR